MAISYPGRPEKIMFSDPKLARLLEWVKNTQDEKLSPSRHTYISPKLEIRESASTGRGLYSKNGVNAREHLIRIPHSFLLNKNTVIRHMARHNKASAKVTDTNPGLGHIFVPYEAHNDAVTEFYGRFSLEDLMAMSSFQILCMYIVLESSRGSSSFWWPFIDALPEMSDFDNTPLVWKVLKVPEHEALLSELPHSTRKRADKVLERFEHDYETVQSAMRKADPSVDIEKLLPLKTFLWAWLSVNSRCLYMEISSAQSHEDNFTMAPFVDFLNHSPDEHCTLKIDATGFRVFTTCAYTEHEQLYLSYGPHCNEFLLCEYGFTLPGDNKWNQLDLSDTIVPMLSKKQAEYLKENNYYGDYTVSFESGASFRTEVALAVLQESDPHESQRLAALIGGIIDTSVYAKNSSILLVEMMKKVIHECEGRERYEYSVHEDLVTRARWKVVGTLYRNMKDTAKRVMDML